MKEELEAEKRALQNIWKKRERAIENLSFNSTAIVSSLNAIFSDLQGGNLIGEEGIKSLENLAKMRINFGLSPKLIILLGSDLDFSKVRILLLCIL